jgi:hypothetical protein
MDKKNKIADTNVSLKYKKPIEGPESDLVKSFLNNIDGLFEKYLVEFKIFSEPFIDIGIPDIVVAYWDKSIFNFWIEKRNYLQKRDIKILHHMYLNGNFTTIFDLKNSLGYPLSELERSIKRLSEADLLIERNSAFKLKSLEDIFFVKAIIAIEAKIKNWRKAFEQACLNELFASDSYVLLPNEKINPKIIEYAENNGIGLIGHQQEDTDIIKEAIKKEIPSSYSSWIFNEIIGRELYYERL